MGLSVEELHKVSCVIAIASGLDNIPAIFATLRGKWIDVLIIDQKTSAEVLKWHDEHQIKEHIL